MTSISQYADKLSDVFLKLEDLKVEAASIIEAAKEAGVNVAALRKVAREMVMDSTKLKKRLDGEAQLEMFRDEVGLLKRKGLSLDTYEARAN